MERGRYLVKRSNRGIPSVAPVLGDGWAGAWGGHLGGPLCSSAISSGDNLSGWGLARQDCATTALGAGHEHVFTTSCPLQGGAVATRPDGGEGRQDLVGGAKRMRPDPCVDVTTGEEESKRDPTCHCHWTRHMTKKSQSKLKQIGRQRASK